MTRLDKIDRQILALLQEDASVPIQQIAEQVGLSVNPCWRRIRQMEQAGVIQGRARSPRSSPPCRRSSSATASAAT